MGMITQNKKASSDLGFFISSFFPPLPSHYVSSSLSFHTQPAATDSKPLSEPSRHASLYRRSSLSLSQSPSSRSKPEIPFARSVPLFVSHNSLSLSLSQMVVTRLESTLYKEFNMGRRSYSTTILLVWQYPCIECFMGLQNFFTDAYSALCLASRGCKKS
ncbi:uncharacterized protein LOC110756555 [Prunus avium]|uniref:Uncharacterized protein LOC110756555 n=1 Tax=Prunus avium TaxID=42229 RepID=A0A6P5SJD8_PRUAV|nr:uncharacterized protein LOC110756555 [Prunus avium]